MRFATHQNLTALRSTSLTSFRLFGSVELFNELLLRLQPIIQFPAGRAAALDVYLVRPAPDLLQAGGTKYTSRSEEHTSELQSHLNLVCRLLLEKKKNHETCN